MFNSRPFPNDSRCFQLLATAKIIFIHTSLWDFHFSESFCHIFVHHSIAFLPQLLICSSSLYNKDIYIVSIICISYAIHCQTISLEWFKSHFSSKLGDSSPSVNRYMNMLWQKATAAACRCRAVSSVISNHAVCLAGSLLASALAVSTMAVPRGLREVLPLRQYPL